MVINKVIDRFFNKNKKDKEAKSGDILIGEKTSFHVKEAYKAMRTNVMFSVPDEGCKVIGVTSAVPSEGKSTTVLNLAITFAQTGTRVLLIDADMRRPNIKRILNVGEGIGLSDVLARFAKAKDAIHHTDYENLNVLFSGNIPPNPVELLASDNMQNMIGELKGSYDYIFIDTPPINVVTDATVISKLLHGIIIVARENVSKKDEVAEALNKLRFVNAKILGLVLNDKMYQSKRGGYYGKYGKYGKYKHYYREYSHGDD
jgi:capsular exopolysaccharide synthesis family protein